MMKPIKQQQEGVVLIVALLILLLIGLIATTVTETNLMQVRMAGNDEAKTDALEKSLALVDAVLERAGNTPVVGDVGDTLPKASLVVEDDVKPLVGTYDYEVTRVGPLETTIPVMDESMAGSGIEYRGARFEVLGSYDGTAQGQGKASVIQGILVKIAAGSQ